MEPTQAVPATTTANADRDRTTTTPLPISTNTNPNAAVMWPTVDGPLGLSEEEAVKYARRFYLFGYALLPLLWAVNCYYFWPVLRHSNSFPHIRSYVVGSAIGFAIFASVLTSWALTFAVGGEALFGPVWDQLVMYNVAEKLHMTDWSM